MAEQTNTHKRSIYIAQSIDGYIARENGDLSWLSLVDRPGEDYGFKQFLEQIDCVVMGRKTYESTLKAYGTPAWPYTNKQVIVLSSHLASVVPGATLYRGRPTHLIQQIKCQQGKGIWIDGGHTISQFLKLGLVDEMTLSILPILLGTGIPLFRIEGEITCKLIGSTSYPSGLVQNKYRVTNT